jgi:hypothetical protein
LLAIPTTAAPRGFPNNGTRLHPRLPGSYRIRNCNDDQITPINLGWVEVSNVVS